MQPRHFYLTRNRTKYQNLETRNSTQAFKKRKIIYKLKKIKLKLLKIVYYTAK